MAPTSLRTHATPLALLALLSIGIASYTLYPSSGKGLRVSPVRAAHAKAAFAQFRADFGMRSVRGAPSQIQKCVRSPASQAVGSTMSPAMPETKPVELAPCPFTVWGSKDIDIDAVQKDSAALPDFPFQISASELGLSADAEKEYIQSHKDEILASLTKHGAVVLRNFQLTKTPQGFRDMWENGLNLSPCQDPLQSVAARTTVSQKDGVFEAVNKPSLNRYFVGMHNEMVGTRTPAKAAFVCFKPAEEGGEFLVLNGQQMLRDLKPEFLKKLYNNDMRYAVAQFPMGFLQNQPEFLQNLLKPVIKTVLDVAIGQKVDFYTESVWDTTTNDGDLVLQVRAAPNPPVLRHPETGEPVWFANIHSHSAKLRDMRAQIYSGGDEGRDKTTGSSKINLTDVFFGDGSPMSEEDLKHVAEVTMKNVKFLKLGQGDVVLVDNYKTQHGRNVFEGTRKNAVTWFE
mmetsp:Transcript_22229/g.39378  ORF Transcript_22229/g.39378 Transcript_22229/m.39378 type:complete len:457 (+) Transcript_22229:38-1408(+)|eukprot:CAMPEP_0197525386 /NCGR_PEP_ID=MMETSP1318-20131121/11878_1 /TAXON_ID=552666 /ORGANISM="Partenskyella glossopodia, Strain RCC365" /LENGTH=456 /DNA_ID=CAMNT_0043078745 /DNA_START=21 /DNA_END=1391 /DNA_ORIENTATION=-